MKKGDLVDVYQDPLTETNFEGKAKIISTQPPSPDGLTVCMVRFDNDDPSSQHIRLIKVTK